MHGNSNSLICRGRCGDPEGACREAKEKELPAPVDDGQGGSAEAVLMQVEEAAGAALDASADGALLSAHRAAAEKSLQHSASKESLAGTKPDSSVEAEASSSVGQPEGGMADLDAMALGGVAGNAQGVGLAANLQGAAPPAGDAGPWKKPPSQPKAIWQRKCASLLYHLHALLSTAWHSATPY